MTDTKPQFAPERPAEGNIAHLGSSHELLGLTVVDACRHRVGEVDGLFIDEEHRHPRLLVVASGGVLGLARTRRLVPADTVLRVDDVVHIDASHEQVHTADFDPEVDPSEAYHRMRAHYGYPPIQQPGSASPLVASWD